MNLIAAEMEVPAARLRDGRTLPAPRHAGWRCVLSFLLSGLTLASLRGASLPRRLVIALDGIAYRDVKALQQGVDGPDRKGKSVHRQAFVDGYFPVSRLVSTFPSASDVAWTEIFGNRPLPGYQRAFYSLAANREITVHGVTAALDYEKEMTWRVGTGFHFAMSYVRPLMEFHYEMDRLVEAFLNSPHREQTYYALIVSTDSAQHMAADTLALLCALDHRVECGRERFSLHARHRRCP